MTEKIRGITGLGTMFSKSMAFFSSPPFEGEKFYDPTPPVVFAINDAMDRVSELLTPLIPGHKGRVQAKEEAHKERVVARSKNPAFIMAPSELPLLPEGTHDENGYSLERKGRAAPDFSDNKIRGEFLLNGFQLCAKQYKSTPDPRALLALSIASAEIGKLNIATVLNVSDNKTRGKLLLDGFQRCASQYRGAPNPEALLALSTASAEIGKLNIATVPNVSDNKTRREVLLDRFQLCASQYKSTPDPRALLALSTTSAEIDRLTVEIGEPSL